MKRIKTFAWVALVCALVVGALNVWLQRPPVDRYQDWMTDLLVFPTNTTGKSLRITFLGTATLLITDGANTLMTDGFFTRPPVSTLLFGRLAPDTTLISQRLAEQGIQHLDAVMPVHSHHDHAMDAPEVARQTGAQLIGSDSTRQIGLGAGLPDSQIHVVTPGSKARFGDFTVTWLASPHSPVPSLIAHLTGNGEVITSPVIPPAALTDYKEGHTFALVIEHPAARFLILGSAAVDPAVLQGLKVDGVFLGIATLSKQPLARQQALVQTAVEQTGARWVIPIHWDDFTQPAEPALVPMPTRIDDLPATLSFLQSQLGTGPDAPTLRLLPMGGQVHIE